MTQGTAVAPSVLLAVLGGALRETAILFATAIAAVVLRERIGPARIQPS